MSATVHSFSRALRESHEQGLDDAFWAAVYRQAFPGYQGMAYLRDSGPAQRSGVDRHISLANGRVIRVEEKVRNEEYNDILLEYLSVYKAQGHPDNAPGWIEKDLACDFLVYAFKHSRRVYLLPWPQLRLAWASHKADWVRKYKKVSAKNEGYNTISVAVPIDVVLASLSEASFIEPDAKRRAA